MATKLTVKRLDLIKAIKERMAANEKAEKERLAALKKNSGTGLAAAISEQLEKNFASIPPGGYYYTTDGGYSYTKASALQHANNCLRSIGLQPIPSSTTPQKAAPADLSGEIAILEMSTDETLLLEDTSDYFKFLRTSA